MRVRDNQVANCYGTFLKDRLMIKAASLFLTAALFALSTVAADAHGHHHHGHHRSSGTTDSHDPSFNPWEFPLCISWNPVTQKNVWICGRYGY